MSSISNEIELALHEAFGDYSPVSKKGAKKTPLVIGQHVVIRNHEGSRIGEGYIENLYPDKRSVRIRDSVSGADLQVEVNLDDYDLWVQDDEIPGSARFGRDRTAYIRPSSPGPYHSTRFSTP